MSIEIDKLSIEIESNSSNASKEIDKLAGSLGNLKNNLNGVNSLKSLSTTLKNLSQVADNINTAQFVQLANGMDRLAGSFSGLNGFKTGATGLLKQINDIKLISDRIGKLEFTKFKSELVQLADSLKPLQALGKTNLGSFFNQLKKIPEVSKQLDTVDFNKFTSQMKQLASAIKPLNGVSIKLGRAFSNLPWHIKSATNQLAKYETRAKSTTKVQGSLMSRLGKSVASFRTMTFIIQGLTGAMASVFEESSQYIENLNLFNVAMGETTQSAMDYARKVQDAMGIDMGEWMGYQGKMNNLITGFDVASDKAQIMSQNLVQLAYDYSSLMNVGVSESFDKINSAMSGQIKGLKEFGNNVSVAMVKQTGLKYGLDGAVSSWDQNTQAIMRYITIMDNASKVDVFNDMARTIATPANAIRILAQQFTMLKRAVGDIASVFVSKLIPYVQIAVKWLTALANTIANFFGFELPKIDYSGIAGGGGALDDVEESADNASDAVGGTSDKIKKLKKQLMGFDELNIINKPDNSDSGDSGSGGAGGGGSIGDIELPQYDFLKGLENQTNEMMDRLSKKMAEMFKPVTESWNKYGKGVLDSIEYQWDEIGKLINSIGTSFSSVWQNGTGEETVSRILKIVTNLNNSVGNLAKNFRVAWDNCNYGTQIVQNLWNSFNTLLECIELITADIEKFTKKLNFNPLLKSVRELSESFEDMAVVVSNYLYDAYKNILKPLSKWTIEKAVPSLVNSLSKAMKGLAKILDAIKPGISVCQKLATALLKICGNAILKGIDAVATVTEVLGDVFKTLKPLISGVTPLVVAFIGAWKVSEMLSTVTAVKNLGLNFSTLKVVMGDVMRVGLKTELGYIKDMILNTNNPLSSMVGFVGKLNTACAPLGNVIQNVGVKMGALSVATDGAVASSGFLGTAMSFLASNPLVAVVGGLTAVSLACVVLMGDSNKLTSAQEKQIKKSQELAEECKKLSSEQKKLNEIGAENAKNVNTQYETAMLYKNELTKLIDENGRVNGSMEKAKFYVDKVNEALGTNIKITDGVIENYKEEANAINESAEAMKRKALAQAYEEEYVNAIKREKEVREQLTIAQNDYSVAHEELNSKLMEYGASVEEIKTKTGAYWGALSQVMVLHGGLITTFDSTKVALEQAEIAFTDNAEAQNNYTSAIRAMDGTVASVTASICEQYGKMAGDGYYTFTSLANGLNDLSLVCDENGERWKLLSETEQQASKEARIQLLNDLVEKSYATGKTYNDMLSTVEEKGAKITQADKEYLKEQYNALAEANKKKLEELDKTYSVTESKKNISNSKLKKADKETLKELTKQWLDSGNEQGLGLIKNLADKLKENGGKASDEIKEIIRNIEKLAKDSKPEVNVDVKAPSKITLDLIKGKIESIKPEITINLKANKDTLNVNGKEYKITLRANGGFPDMGEMFVAREAGPELVGRIGKKTAVANNDQIVSAVSGGVYNAMRSAMAGMNGGGGKYEIHTTVMLDGKQVGKSVFEQHNGIVRQTGKSPLLI